MTKTAVVALGGNALTMVPGQPLALLSAMTQGSSLAPSTGCAGPARRPHLSPT